MADWYNDEDFAGWAGDDDDVDNDEDDDGEYGRDDTISSPDHNANAQHVIFLIDCDSFDSKTNTILDPNYTDGSYTTVPNWSIQAILACLRDKIRQVTIQKYGKRDGIGIILYNTRLRYPTIHMGNDSNTASTTKNQGEPRRDDDDDDEDQEPALLGSNASSAGAMMSRVHELLPLERPGLPAVRLLQSTQEDVFRGRCELDLSKEYGRRHDDGDEFNKEQQSSTSLSTLHIALELAVQTFQTATCVKQRPGRHEEPDLKHIWILTGNDHAQTPSSSSNVTASVVENSKDNGIDIYVWPVITDVSKFDTSYYVNALHITCIRDQHGDDDDPIDDLVDKMDKLTKKVRRVFTAPLVMPGDAEGESVVDDGTDTNGTTATAAADRNGFNKPRMMLDFFTLVRPTVKPRLVNIHQQTGKALSKIAQYVTTNKPEILGEQRYFGDKRNETGWRQRERSYIEFAGEKVPMTVAEKAAIQALGRPRLFPCLVLHGFKPDRAVPFHHTMRTSYYAYPNETDCPGSLDAFVHLHAAMINLHVVAIGSFLPPRSTNARYVSIRALPEELDDDGEALVSPPGMLITYLPYEDEKRAVPVDKAMQHLEETGRSIASEELVAAAVAVVQKQTLAGAEIGGQFENAYTSRLWNYVERVALDEGKKKERMYDTEINKEQILKLAGVEITSFADMLPPDIKAERGTKRKTAPTAATIKVEDDTGIDWEGAYRTGTLSQFKNDELKRKLKSLGTTVAGTKAVLVKRLSTALGGLYGNDVDDDDANIQDNKATQVKIEQHDYDDDTD